MIHVLSDVVVLAVMGNCLSGKSGSAGSKAIDIFAEAFIFGIHCAKGDKNFIGTGIIILGDNLLKPFHFRLDDGRIIWHI